MIDCSVTCSTNILPKFEELVHNFLDLFPSFFYHAVKDFQTDNNKDEVMLHSLKKTKSQMYCLKQNYLNGAILRDKFNLLAEIYLILHMMGARTQN